MDMKVNALSAPAQIEQGQQARETDGSFKFTLASHVEEAGLQERLNLMMQEITMQGNKIAKRMDVRDMKRYRSMIKEFMNEIVSRSHSFSREIFWTDGAGIVCMGLYGWWTKHWMNWQKSL